jgi:hypothetical protein
MPPTPTDYLWNCRWLALVLPFFLIMLTTLHSSLLSFSLPSVVSRPFHPLPADDTHRAHLFSGLNILIGLIFRASAKSKRSITSWREHGKSVLPNHITGSSMHTVHFGGDNADTGSLSSKAGYGFGRQGEKAAGLKGTYFFLVFCDVLVG